MRKNDAEGQDLTFQPKESTLKSPPFCLYISILITYEHSTKSSQNPIRNRGNPLIISEKIRIFAL